MSFSPELDFRADSVAVRNDSLIVTLEDGRFLGVPIGSIAALEPFTDEQLQKVEVIGRGVAISWPDLDVDLSVYRLFVRVVRPQAAPVARDRIADSEDVAKHHRPPLKVVS